jgi:hypothetical protein
MNEYEIMIKNLENRVTELEKQLFAGAVKTVEPVKWQPKGGDWCIGIEGDVFEFANNEIYYHFGTAHKTKEQAQRASVEMRRFNRLLALRDELCGDAVDDLEENKETYFVFYNNQLNMWKNDYILNLKFETPLFTSHESAQKACDMLNSGEVEL